MKGGMSMFHRWQSAHRQQDAEVLHYADWELCRASDPFPTDILARML